MRKMRWLVPILAALCICALVPALAAGFSDDPDAVENALKSVLMLEVYNDDGLIGTGSGFVAFDNRTLITNYHVVENADYLIAYSDVGDPYILMEAKMLDEKRDIAILAFFSPTDLVPLDMNSDGTLKRAQRVVAVGSPLGITNTVAMGNISGIYTDNGVSMIQFTAPISKGSSGGALFDDDGNVIGVTTATLTDGQNLNLAVHIREVLELYGAWDGTTFSINEGGTGLPGTVIVPEATIAPLIPTATPRPTATPEPTDKPWATSVPANVLTITKVTMQSNGSVRVTWSGGKAPYNVYYQIANTRTQSKVNPDYFHWYEEESYSGNSATLDYMIPDHLYRIDIRDANGNTADTFFEFNSSSVTLFDPQVTITLRQKRSGVASTVHSYSAAAIESGYNGNDAFGLTIKIGLGPGGLSQDYPAVMRVAAELPNGDVDTVDLGKTTIYRGGSDDYTYWEFFDLWVLWDDLMDKHDCIPTGTYKLYLYLDTKLVETKNFTVN